MTTRLATLGAFKDRERDPSSSSSSDGGSQQAGAAQVALPPVVVRCQALWTMQLEKKSPGLPRRLCASRALGANMCTLIAGGVGSFEQPLFRCRTCMYNVHLFLCLTCVTSCHRGHDVMFVGSKKDSCACFSRLPVGDTAGKCCVGFPLMFLRSVGMSDSGDALAVSGAGAAVGANPAAGAGAGAGIGAGVGAGVGAGAGAGAAAAAGAAPAAAASGKTAAGNFDPRLSSHPNAAVLVDTLRSLFIFHNLLKNAVRVCNRPVVVWRPLTYSHDVLVAAVALLSVHPSVL